MAPPTFERRGPAGAAASTHHLATQTAMSVLARGGTAFDAVVAGGFVLQVVEPHLCGPGGEVPAVFVTAADPTPRVLCGQGTVPAAATVEQYRGLGLTLVPGTGLLAATVPGAWDAWLTLLRDHGTWELADVLTPALGYAAGGFPLVPGVGRTLERVGEHFRAHWPGSARTWLPDGTVPRDAHRLPELAATWERLLAEARGPSREARIDAARAAWSRGFVAEAVDAHCRTPARDETGRDHAGVLTGDDLAGWSATYEDPVVAPAGGGWAVAKCGPWSQGPVLGQTLRLLDGADLSYVDGVATADTVHIVAEAAKLALADREAWYGDAAPVPMADLLSDAYTADRRTLLGDLASRDLRPGSPGGRPPHLGTLATDPNRAVGTGVEGPGGGEPTVGTGEPTLGDTGRAGSAPGDTGRGGSTRGGSGRGGPTPDGPAPFVDPPLTRDGVARGDTVHIDVVDAAGNMVSATPSGGWLQSSPTIPGLGFCLGTRAQMCWLEEGLPSTLTPGRRPRTTLSPSLALRDGEPVLAFGTPGGDQQDQWQLCFLLAHLRGGLDLQAAIDAPAWHTTGFPASFAPRGWEPAGLVVESRLGAATIDDLARRGHVVTDAGPWALGRLSAVGRGGDLLRAAADRRSGYGGAAAF